MTKRVAVKELDDTVKGAEIDWHQILDKTEREVSGVIHNLPSWAAKKVQPGHTRRHGYRDNINSYDKFSEEPLPSEEVEFSSVAVDSVDSIKNDITEIFGRTKDIISEYRSKCIQSDDTLSEFQSVKGDMLERIEDLLQENDEMKLVILSHGSATRTSHQSRGRNRRGVASGEHEERAKEDLRRELLENHDSSGIEDEFSFPGDRSSYFNSLWHKLSSHFPLEKDLMRVRASLGLSVAAYFSLLRSLLITYTFLCVVACFSSISHLTNQKGSLISNISSSRNIIPEFMYFSSFSKVEGPFYVCLVVFCMCFIILSASMKAISEDKISKYYSSSKNKDTHSYSDLILVGWDNNITGSAPAIQSVIESNEDACKELLQKSKEASVKSPSESFCGFNMKRFIGFLSYFCIQGTCYVLVSFLATSDVSVGGSDSSLSETVRIISPAVAISLYNNIFPYFIRLITEFEGWESKVEFWVLTGRMYISVMANIVVIGTSYGLLADPFLLATNDVAYSRRRLEQEFYKSTYGCRLNQVGDGIAVNILVDLLVYILLGLAIHPLRKIISWQCRRDYKLLEYNVANRVITSLYLLGLMILNVPFAPLLLIFSPIIIVVRFKFDIYMALNFYLKPISSLPASLVRKAFSMYYCTTAVFVGLTSTSFLLATRTFPKECAIQDRSVKLCVGDVVAGLCDLDTSSGYFELYSDSSYCSEGYPACVCARDIICGPFLTETAAINPLSRYVESNTTLSVLWYLFMETSSGAWFLFLIAFISFSFRTNSFRITKEVKDETESKFEQQVTALTQDIQKQSKVIERAKQL